jgi:O-antigen ligase
MEFIRKYYLYFTIPIIFITTFLGWRYDLIYYIVIGYTVLFLVNLFIVKDSTMNLYLVFFIPPLLTKIVSGATMDDFDKESLMEYLVYAVPVIIIYSSFIIAIIRDRKRIKLDFVLLGIIIYFITMIPSVIVTINPYNTYLMIGLYVNSLLLFFYFLSQNIKKEHFFIMSILFAIQASIQMVLVLYEGGIAELVLHKQITIGWSVSNNIGQYIVFALPFLAYFSVKFKRVSFLFHILSILLILSLLMTGARASFVGLLLVLPPMIYLYIKNFSWKHDIRDFLLIVPPIGIVLHTLYQHEVLQAIWERLITKALDSSSRFDIWLNSIQHFNDYKWFGSGLLTTSDFEYPLTSYHNMFIDSLTNSGVIGFVGTLALIISIIVAIHSNRTTFNFCIGLSLITVFANAMLDTVHLNPITLMLIFVTFSFIQPKKDLQEPQD